VVIYRSVNISQYTVAGKAIGFNRFTLLRLPNALRCRFTAASGILKQLEHTFGKFLKNTICPKLQKTNYFKFGRF
jgi:hypothetical protein